MFAGLAAALVIGGPCGCGRKTAPPPPPIDLPHTMPSEVEAANVAENAPEAIPLPSEPKPTPPPPLPGQGPAKPEDQSEKLYGFRVQLFASGNPDLAESRASEMRPLFDETVHVEFEGLLYKVQVGDCRTRAEAEALKRKAIAEGFHDAFITDAIVDAKGGRGRDAK